MEILKSVAGGNILFDRSKDYISYQELQPGLVNRDTNDKRIFCCEKFLQLDFRKEEINLTDQHFIGIRYGLNQNC